MSKTKKVDLWRLVTDYFEIYLKDVRRMSNGTIETYRYGLFSFVTFMCNHLDVEISLLSLDHFSRNNVKDFISHLYVTKSLSTATCNLRLSILKSFLRYCADEYVHLYAVYHAVKNIPIARIEQKSVDYLTEENLKTLLAAPDPCTRLGKRDSMILIFLYETGCRVQELVDIQLGHLHLDQKPNYVVITGKGNKTRMIPLMEKTVLHLYSYIYKFHQTKDAGRPLFYTMKQLKPSKLSTDAIAALLKK